MIEKMREFDVGATKETVVKKINSLKTAYRRELKKVIDSERSGAGEEDAYVPHLWYFDLLNFTRNQEMPRKTQTNVEDEDEESELHQFTAERDKETSESGLFSPRESPSISPPSTPHSLTLGPSTSTRPSTQTTRTMKRQLDKCDDILHVIGKRFTATAPLKTNLH
ncbi:uncharacterized protein LOC126750307 [Anthonomus grandis grandis]|uniref:uncharacterized protein LOC126750307 n=1 Tax=Anthonomus grandis grandis TaxID=2921223 RepID=UPI002165584D|nr:uncharacterized protein LOC126750307 [Anthonomus grandis grandis]